MNFALFLFFSFLANSSFALDRADITVCANADTVSGVDVSDFDPNTNWAVVQKSGNAFAFIKATEGASFHNRDFATDWKAAKESGLIRGAYHFFHPNIDPALQAKEFLAEIGTLTPEDLPPLFDWEISGGESARVQIARALLWLAQVQAATGKTPLIYVAPGFWKYLGDTSAFAQYPLFIANYEVSCPDIPAPWTNWTFWQKGVGPVDGIHANSVDLDVFNGSLAQLQSLAQQ